MSDDNLQNLSDLELEFMEEVKGFGSLSLQLVQNSNAESDDNVSKIGYDIRPEDIEALYFEGIGIPRWESIKADSVAQQLEIYEESMQKIMSDYPLINRVNDTDKKVDYNAEEVLNLHNECKKVLENTSNPKAVRAVQKFTLACNKAAEGQMGLRLIPT